MSGSQSASFRSKFYPSRKSKFAVLQEYALKYYAVFILVVMIIAVVRANQGHSIFWISIIGFPVAIFLGNFFADVFLNRNIAEIFFVGDSFFLISVSDALTRQPGNSFPLKFANPVRNGDRIQLHYQDNVVILKREDWDEFEVIWQWLSQLG